MSPYRYRTGRMTVGELERGTVYWSWVTWDEDDLFLILDVEARVTSTDGVSSVQYVVKSMRCATGIVGEDAWLPSLGSFTTYRLLDR